MTDELEQDVSDAEGPIEDPSDFAEEAIPSEPVDVRLWAATALGIGLGLLVAYGVDRAIAAGG